MLHVGNGGRYEVAPLMTPETVTPWAQTLLHRGEQLEVEECWQLDNWEAFIGVGFGWGVGFSTLYLTLDARWASLLWFVYFSMRICGGVQLLSCSSLVDHISISLILNVNLIGRRSFFGGIKHEFFFVQPFLQMLYLKNMRLFMHIPPPLPPPLLSKQPTPMFYEPTNKSNNNL